MAVSAETQAWCLQNLGATSSLESESKAPRPYGNQPIMFSNGKLAPNQQIQKAKKLTPRRKEVIRAFFREAYARPHKFGVTDENGWVHKLLQSFREPLGSLTTFDVEQWLSNPEFEERYQRLQAVFREKLGDKNGMSSRASLSSSSYSQSVSMPTSPSSSNGDDQTETDESIESILTGKLQEGLRQPGVQAVHNLEKAAGMKKNETVAQPEQQQREQVEEEQQTKQQVGGECPVQVYHGGFFIQVPPRSQHTTFLIQPTAWSVSVYPTSDPDSTVAAFSGLNINGGQTYPNPNGGSPPNGKEAPTENGNGTSSMVPPGTLACNCLSCSGKK